QCRSVARRDKAANTSWSRFAMKALSEAGKPASSRAQLRPSESSRPFQLRMDRVLWLGLWAASLVILAISLVASYSRGDSKEFVVAPSSSSSGRAFQAPGAALESNSRPEITPTPAPQTSMPSCATGSQECQCNDFATQPEAQAYYQQHPPAAGHDVDPDRDGVVCEWLPQTAPSSGRLPIAHHSALDSNPY